MLFRRVAIGESSLDVFPAIAGTGDVLAFEIPAEHESGLTVTARTSLDRQELEQLRDVIDEALS